MVRLGLLIWWLHYFEQLACLKLGFVLYYRAVTYAFSNILKSSYILVIIKSKLRDRDITGEICEG